MKKSLCLLISGLIVFSCSVSFAAPNRGLFGDVDGFIMLTTEKDITGVDNILYKNEMSIYKMVPVGTFDLMPYYYFKGEYYNSPFSNSIKLVENTLGLDGVIQQSNMEKVSVGVGYKAKLNSDTTTDSILLARFRLDF